jgi:hypothetical protein
MVSSADDLPESLRQSAPKQSSEPSHANQPAQQKTLAVVAGRLINTQSTSTQ